MAYPFPASTIAALRERGMSSYAQVSNALRRDEPPSEAPTLPQLFYEALLATLRQPARVDFVHALTRNMKLLEMREIAKRRRPVGLDAGLVEAMSHFLMGCYSAIERYAADRVKSIDAAITLFALGDEQHSPERLECMIYLVPGEYLGHMVRRLTAVVSAEKKPLVAQLAANRADAQNGEVARTWLAQQSLRDPASIVRGYMGPATTWHSPSSSK